MVGVDVKAAGHMSFQIGCILSAPTNFHELHWPSMRECFGPLSVEKLLDNEWWHQEMKVLVPHQWLTWVICPEVEIEVVEMGIPGSSQICGDTIPIFLIGAR